MAVNIPVLLAGVPPVLLSMVQTYVVTEGYKSASIAASPFVQMVGLMTKKIEIDALLVDKDRAFRPALEALALNSVPPVVQVAAGLESFAGIPVVSKNFIHLDMQITQLKFTQDNDKRETLNVHIELTNVPRPKQLGGVFGIAEVLLGVGSAWF
jgi:hypothetical protein